VETKVHVCFCDMFIFYTDNVDNTCNNVQQHVLWANFESIFTHFLEQQNAKNCFDEWQWKWRGKWVFFCLNIVQNLVLCKCYFLIQLYDYLCFCLEFISLIYVNIFRFAKTTMMTTLKLDRNLVYLKVSLGRRHRR